MTRKFRRMKALQTIRDLAAGIAERFRDPGFSCGDCERNARCGRPPTADCPIKLARLERDPTGYELRMRARAEILRSGFWA